MNYQQKGATDPGNPNSIPLTNIASLISFLLCARHLEIGSEALRKIARKFGLNTGELLYLIGQFEQMKGGAK